MNEKSKIEEETRKILHLTLTKKWFDMIYSGIKKEEYREIKEYWDKRLSKEYDIIKFVNGYGSDRPTILIECLGIEIGKGNTEWGGGDEDVYIIKLGEILEKDYTV